MKQWMNYVMMIGLTAGTASAAWPFGGNQAEEQKAPRAVERPMQERQRPQMTPEQMEKMKAQREEVMKLGEAARNETDPAKKEALVGQLRAKLTEIADQMLAAGKKRLERAEQEVAKQKERQADAEKNKSARIEDQIKRILAGEPLKGPGGRHPGRGERDGEVAPAAE